MKKILGIVATLLLLLSSVSPLFAAAGRVTIDSGDRHRFLMNGNPWYAVGYYPNIAALTHDQTDYNNYYRTLIDKQSANGVNYMRAVFNMGQEYNNSMNLYQRTGPGSARDGKAKFDLNRFNQGYFDYWKKVISYAQSRDIVVQLVIFDNWHNKKDIVDDGGSKGIWGMRNDYYNGDNNINGLDADTIDKWTNPGHAVVGYQKKVIERVVDELSGYPNIVYEISNENYYNATWETDLSNHLTNYERNRGVNTHLVMPRDLPNHDNAGGKTADPARAHSELVNKFNSMSRPLIADNDGGGSLDATGVRRRAWAALTAGAHMDYFHGGMWSLSVLNSSAVTDAMRYTGNVNKFLTSNNINLRGMRPSDNLVSRGWALAQSGSRYIVFLQSGGSVNVSNLPSSYTATWYSPIDNTSRNASGGPSFSAPDGRDWVLYIRSGGASATNTPTPRATNTPTPRPTNTPTAQSARYRADTNGDNDVDEDDYQVWRNNYGRTTSSGDFNRDGTVDGRDYIIWLNEFTG